MSRTETKIFNRSSKMLRLIDDKFTTNMLSIAFIGQSDSRENAKRALVAYLLKDSCKKYPDMTALNTRLNRLYGASLSATVAKIGDFHAAVFSIIGINDRFVQGEELTKECVELLCEVLTQPNITDRLFDSTAFETQKRCLVEEIQSEIADKRYYAVNRCTQELLKGERAAIHRLGSIDDINSIKPEELYDTWQDMLNNNGLFVFSASDSENDIESMIGDKINLYPQPDFDMSEVSFNANGRLNEIIEQMPVNQAKLVLGLRTKQRPNDLDKNAMKMMAALLGGTPSSLLFKNVREKMSLCYYCAARYDSLKGTVLIDSGLEESNREKAQSEILKCLEMIRNGDFTDDELEETRKAVINSLLTMSDSQMAQLGWYYGQATDDEFASPQAAIEDMRKVTRQDVITAANAVELKTVYLLKPQKAAE